MCAYVLKTLLKTYLIHDYILTLFRRVKIIYIYSDSIQRGVDVPRNLN